MALKLEDKKALVAEVNEVAPRAQSVVAAEYRGLTVAQITELRAKARASGVYMRVVKNTLARRAVAGTQFECVGDEAQGPADPRLLGGRPGRGRATDQGFRQGQRQARADARVARRHACCPGKDLERVASLPTGNRRSRSCSGVLKAPDRQVRAHARRASREARADDRRGQGPEAGGRLTAAAVIDIGYQYTILGVKTMAARKKNPRRNLQHDRDGDRRPREDDGRQVRRHRCCPGRDGRRWRRGRGRRRSPRSRPSSP